MITFHKSLNSCAWKNMRLTVFLRFCSLYCGNMSESSLKSPGLICQLESPFHFRSPWPPCWPHCGRYWWHHSGSLLETWSGQPESHHYLHGPGQEPLLPWLAGRYHRSVCPLLGPRLPTGDGPLACLLFLVWPNVTLWTWREKQAVQCCYAMSVSCCGSVHHA